MNPLGMPDEDLIRLAPQCAEIRWALSFIGVDDPFAPLAWFETWTEVPPSRVEKAAHRGTIRKRDKSGKLKYSVLDVRQEWPADFTPRSQPKNSKTQTNADHSAKPLAAAPRHADTPPR